MISYIQKKYANAFLKPFLLWYLKKERVTRINGFTMVVKPGVFHPKYFFSTRYLFEFVSKLELRGKRFLEIGSGSGIISLLAFQKQAVVSSCDLNEDAVDCTRQNFLQNFGIKSDNFNVYTSDLFDSLPDQLFDTIVINPPYFFKTVDHVGQLAWNCGVNGEYFSKLFFQLKAFIKNESDIYMVLADNCEIDRIVQIAKQYHFSLSLVEQKKIRWEVNYMFKIQRLGC